MANEKFSEFTVKTDLTEFTGLVGFETNTANYYITTANFYDDLEVNLDLTSFTNVPATSAGKVLTINATSNGLEWAIPASGGVSSITFGTTGLTPSVASTGAVTVAGTLVVGHGGTGQTTYTVGDILYADTSSTLAKLPASATSGHVLTSNGTGVAPSYQAAPGGGTNSYMLTGIIDGVSSSASGEFTQFGGSVTPLTQGSGFSVFVNSQLTHLGFKYISSDPLQSNTNSYSITIYESNANFDDLDAENLSNFTSLSTMLTITGDGAGSSDFGDFPFANIALGSPITLTANKYYVIVGQRSGGALFDTSEEAQITLRITE